MAKYAYPAIFVKEDVGYSVTFPDLEGCFSAGETLPEAMEMAADALCLVLYNKEKSGEIIPPASNVKQVQAETDAEVYLIFVILRNIANFMIVSNHKTINAKK